MSRGVAIGRSEVVAGYALAGVEVIVAADAAAAEAAWETLPADVALVILTPAVRAALGRRLDERPDLVWAELE